MPRVLCMKRPEYHPRYAFEGDFTTPTPNTANTEYGMNFGTGYTARIFFYFKVPFSSTRIVYVEQCYIAV
jgi:hypothetical protein